MNNDDISRVFRAMRWTPPHEHMRGAPAHGFASSFWAARVTSLHQIAIVTDDWITKTNVSTAHLAQTGRILFQAESGKHNVEAVLDVDGTTTYVCVGQRGRVDVSVAAHVATDAASVLAKVRSSLPKDVPEGCRVEIKLWSYNHGAHCRDETIDVCRWDEIAANYSARTRTALAPLMLDPDVTPSGKLVLWIGPPGTGKTYALRAFAWEQRQSVTIHYVLDPEVFLERIDYVMSVFRGDDDHGHDDDSDVDEGLDAKGRKRSCLIVLEDAGELLGADAISRSGHGLSRLLNLTDGLPGQATRTRVLITTNEDVGRLHPAVTRPGRCGALVRFSPLEDREARDWLQSRDRAAAAPPERSATTIAELYARLTRGEGHALTANTRLGFSAGA